MADTGLEQGGLNRRRLFKYAGTAVLTTGAAPILAACGSGSDSSGGSAAKADAAGPASSAIGSQLRDILGLPTGKAAGAGMKIKLGGSFPFSGYGSNYAPLFFRGATLAVAHIKAAGGPDFQFASRDNASGDAQKATAEAKELGLAGTPMVLTSYAAAQFAEVPYYPQYKELAIEPGGATSLLQSKPFYYMTRAESPDDVIGGILQYCKAKLSSAKKYVVLAGDTGGGTTQKTTPASCDPVFQSLGLPQPEYVYTPAAGNDFSAAFSKLRQLKPDVVILLLYGTAPPLFMKQYVTAGLNAQVIGADYLPDMQRVAGSAFDDFIFSFDYFDAKNPGNEWGKLFAAEYLKRFKEEPIYYSANYYESTFLLWDLVRRIIATGGDPTKQGDLYVKALESHPTFASVYGAGRHGTMEIDTTTHALKARPMAVLKAGDPPTLLATSGLRGADFKLA
jgi:branched-chain amino acid transport system substrate-binding protein